MSDPGETTDCPSGVLGNARGWCCGGCGMVMNLRLVGKIPYARYRFGYKKSMEKKKGTSRGCPFGRPLPFVQARRLGIRLN
jgi:hypothetical protein